MEEVLVGAGEDGVKGLADHLSVFVRNVGTRRLMREGLRAFLLSVLNVERL